eukprot:1954098-Rhodomonas_salina.3
MRFLVIGFGVGRYQHAVIAGRLPELSDARQRRNVPHSRARVDEAVGVRNRVDDLRFDAQ